MQLNDIIARLKGESLTTSIDVGHYAIKLVTVEHRRNGMLRVVAADSEQVPEGAIVDNEIRDERAVLSALANLLDRSAPGGVRGDLVVSVNWTAGVLCDRVSVKVDKNRSEDETILQAAMSRSPFDDTDNVLDYEILNRRDDGVVDTLVVAAKNNMLNNWASFFSKAGLKPVAIDIDAFAICNVFFKVYEGADPEQPVAIFNMGERKAHISYTRNGMFQAARAVQSGTMDNAMQQISRQISMEPAVCRAILMGKKKDFDADQFNQALGYVCEEMSMGVEIAMRYFGNSDSANSGPPRIYLTGGGACLPGLAKHMSERLGLEVEVFDPFLGIEIDGGYLPADPASRNTFTPALGLALRRF